MAGLLKHNAGMSDYLDLAISAARAAGASIKAAANDIPSLAIEQKSPHDYVSEVDRAAERIVVEHIVSRFPEHQILGEEFGQQGQAQSDFLWVIDPLDGTTNFLRSIPHYAVSIALIQGGVITHGVVYDAAKDELFSTQKGAGAFLNGKPIKVSQIASVRGGLFATGVPFSGDNLANVDQFTESMTALLELKTSGIRRLGSAALDLAYVAAGRYDGYWEANLNSWDIAAGVLLVQEAGGVVSDLAGSQNYLQSGDIVAANIAVQAKMASVTCRFYSR